MKSCLLAIGSSVIVLVSSVVVAESENRPGIEDELATLVETTAKLIETLEGRAELSGDQSLQKIAIAVHLLDIRTRQQEALQGEYRGLDDREQNYLGYIALNHTKMDNLDKSIAAAIDESKKLELQSRRSQVETYAKNHEQRLEYLTRRRVEIQNQLIEGERRLREVEDMVQEWLSLELARVKDHG